MDDWEDPDERLKAEVKRELGPAAADADVHITRRGGGSIISISGLGPLHGPTCKKCGTSLITIGNLKWWRRNKHICPSCDPDHPSSIFFRNLDQDMG